MSNSRPIGKFVKQQVTYTPYAKNHRDRCEVCKHFEPPNSCAVVYGEVKPEAWCNMFVRRNQ